jgi:hypothetical protein
MTVRRIGTALAVLAAVALSGCGALPGKFENALTVTLTGDRVFVTSLYGPVGITSELREADAAALRRLLGAER